MSTSLRLPDLDPDDPRTVSQQIANALRSAILRGLLKPGDQLPSQTELVSRYGVARETIKAALRVLDRDHLIVSRQGSGSFVRSRLSTTPDVAEFLKGAYDRPHVTIDYAGWRGETLSNIFPRTLDGLREDPGRVRTLRIRLLLTDPQVPAGLPVPIDPEVDSPALRAALAKVTERAVSKIRHTANDAVAGNLVQEATVHVRVHRLGPTIKIFGINGERNLIGFYPTSEQTMRIDGRDIALHHPSGWELATFDRNDPAHEPSFASQAQTWFESVWNTIGQDY